MLASRKFPCSGVSVNEADPSASTNPSIHSSFSHYTVYKIGEAGVLAENTGDMSFKHMVIADCKQSGI